MSKKMLINATHPEENRVAIVEDGVLTELDIEVAGREPTKGNIYKAVVVRVETGLQAAFVDYGAERLGFLQIDEINYSAVKPGYNPAEDGPRPRINDLLHRGQEFLVQITKEERGTKGAALTTYLSLAGRYMVLMPGSQTRGVSRKAESDSQRKELKKAMSSIDLAEGIGYIVRTAALDQTREELERDYRYLIRLYESIKQLDQKAKAPALIYKESNLMIRSIRDYFTTDMDEVLVDDPKVFTEAKEFFQMVMPDHVKLVKLHQERRPIFSRYQIEDQIETLSRNKVALPSGGSIVIDPTEALVAIDVNSGKMSSEQGVEATATKTNLEAAEEVGRQLRLRDLGGLIVIDFIDMRERKNMRQVENQVKKSLENDKARVSVGRISKFGLLELSRQRIKAALTQGSHMPCPHCNGTGQLKSPETQAIALLRKIHASAAKGQISRIDAQLPIDVAAYVLNHNREELVDMERRYQLQIHIHGNRDFLADQVEIETQKKDKEKPAPSEYVAAGTLPMVIEGVVKAEVVEKEAVQETRSEPAQLDTPEMSAEPGKKRRRRKRRKPSDTIAAEDAQPADQDPIETQVSATEDDHTIDTDVPDTTPTEQLDSVPAAKKPQKRRRSRRKPKAAVVPAQNETTSEPTEQSIVEEKPAPKKPARRGRKKSDQEQTTQETSVVNAVKPAEEQVSRSFDAPDEKAKPPRSSRAKPKTAKAEAAKVSTPQTEAKPVVEKPAKKVAAPRTRKKIPTEKAAATVKAVKATPTTDTTSEVSVAEKTKPKRTRTVNKKPTETEPSTVN